MGSSARVPCYLVEWYRPEPSADVVDRAAAELDHLTAEGGPVQLLLTVAAPDDEVIFGVFAAASADDVMSACRQVGLPAQRLSDAVVESRSATDWALSRIGRRGPSGDQKP
ncbi:MAG TPA: hypothetical protein VFB19_03260 [Mycobacterium sp.]|nr:hypothetical protein [Mycobacterium sp.]